MAWAALSTWLPDRAPQRRDVIGVGAMLTFIGVFLRHPGGVAWSWVVVGFVLCGLWVGPGRRWAAGQRLDTWLRSVDSLVLTVAGLIAIAVIGGALLETVAGPIARGFLTGIAGFIALSLTANALPTELTRDRHDSTR